MKKYLFFTCILLASASQCLAENIAISITIPALSADPYHRPYVATWIENKNRNNTKTIAIWHEKTDWLKDLRQWWRKPGQADQQFDQVSSATRRPGSYTINWSSNTAQFPAGEYIIHIEAVREEGGREFLSQKIQLGQKNRQHYSLHGQHELGHISITIE